MIPREKKDWLKARGFDKCSGTDVGCSQCDVIVVNGMALHEIGCPNATHQCNGCWAQIPRNQRYCADCG